MRLLRARYQDIFSIGEVELDLASRGLVLVNGFSHDEGDPNGSGKSSVAHKALAWCLFGQAANGAKADKVKRRGAKSAFAEVDFIGVDGFTYTVRRTRGPNSLSLFRWEGEEKADVSCKLEKETQPLIDRALGRNYHTWLQSDFFGQGRKLSYAELTPAAQKEVLDDVLPVRQLDQWEESAKSALTEIRETRSELDKELARIKGMLSVLGLHMETIEKVFKSFEAARQTRELTLRGTLDNVSIREAKLHSKLQDVKKMLESMPSDYHSKIEASSINQRMHSNGLRQMLDEKTKATDVVAQWDRYVAYRRARLHTISEICPACENPLTDIQIAKLHEHNAAFMVEIQQGEENLLKAGTYLEHVNGQETAMMRELDRITSDLNSYTNFQLRRDFLLREQDDCLKNLADLDIDRLKSELEKVVNEPNPHIDTLATAKSQFTDAQEQLKAANAQIDKIMIAIEAVSFWRNAFAKDVRNFLYQEVTGFLNARATYYLAELRNPQLKVEFSAVKELASGELREDFNVGIQSDTGGPEYDLLSGGEQQLASFAIGLALADLAASQAEGECRFSVLDEPFVNLGPTNSERLIDFIQRILIPRKDTILLISNEASLQELITSQITVEKRNGITSLVSQ